MAMRTVRNAYKDGKHIDGAVVVGFRLGTGKIDYTLMTDSRESSAFLKLHDVIPAVVSVDRVKIQKTKRGFKPSLESIRIYSTSELKEMVEETMKRTRERFEKEGRLEDYENNEYAIRNELFEAYKCFNIAFGRQESKKQR